MKNKSLTVAISAVAVAMICIVAVLAVKMSSSNNPSIAPDTTNTFVESHSFELPSYSYEHPSYSANYSENSTTDRFDETSTLTPSETVSQTDSLTQTTTTIAETTAKIVSTVNKAFSEVFTLPKAPQYIPPDTDLDFAKINLASYKYNPDGNFYYTDDKDCWQKDFGFNEVYDNFAPITMMYYDTVRTIFEYGGKEWLIQTWKGQYGMAFVGGEVGVYTRKPGSGGSHFVCADKEDWLNMEMAFMWDEYSNGNYRAVFNRNYDKYWWATGFVVGFPNGSLRKTLTEFRLVTHITFKDTEMANAFCKAFEANGFTRVSKLDNNSPDTFVQVGPDVAFVWQNINHN